MLLCRNAAACMLEVGRQVQCCCPSTVGWFSYSQRLWSADVWTLATRFVSHYVMCYMYRVLCCTLLIPCFTLVLKRKLPSQVVIKSSSSTSSRSIEVLYYLLSVSNCCSSIWKSMFVHCFLILLFSQNIYSSLFIWVNTFNTHYVFFF